MVFKSLVFALAPFLLCVQAQGQTSFLPKEFQWHQDAPGHRPQGYRISPASRGLSVVPFAHWATPNQFALSVERLKKAPPPITAPKVALVQLHHTAIPRLEEADYHLSPEDKEARCEELANSVLRAHLNNGWVTIGYSFLYCPLNRTFYGGREWKGAIPAAAKGQNPGTVAISVLGQYSTEPSDIQTCGEPNPLLPTIVEDITVMVAWLGEEWGLNFDVDARVPMEFLTEPVHPFTYHRELASRRVEGALSTGCPGQRLIDVVPTIRRILSGDETLPGAPLS